MGISIKTRQAYSEIDEFLGLFREYFMQENENGEKVPMILERHYPKELVDLEYTEDKNR